MSQLDFLVKKPLQERGRWESHFYLNNSTKTKIINLFGMGTRARCARHFSLNDKIGERGPFRTVRWRVPVSLDGTHCNPTATISATIMCVCAAQQFPMTCNKLSTKTIIKILSLYFPRFNIDSNCSYLSTPHWSKCIHCCVINRGSSNSTHARLGYDNDERVWWQRRMTFPPRLQIDWTARRHSTPNIYCFQKK